MIGQPWNPPECLGPVAHPLRADMRVHNRVTRMLGPLPKTLDFAALPACVVWVRPCCRSGVWCITTALFFDCRRPSPRFVAAGASIQRFPHRSLLPAPSVSQPLLHTTDTCLLCHPAGAGSKQGALRQVAAASPAGNLAGPPAAAMQASDVDGGDPHARPGVAAALLAGLASRLSRAFAAGDLPQQLATGLARTFPGAVSVRWGTSLRT